MSLDALAAASPAQIGFLEGARALYYEEQTALIDTAIAKLIPGGENHG